MGLRRQGRELALQALYGLDVNPTDLGHFLEHFWEEHPAPSGARSFAEKLVRGVAAHREEIDARLTAASKHWTLPRMAKVDRSILRMGVFELFFLPEIPRKVTINEAVEIAKVFGTEDSPSFVNGILDEVSAAVTEKE